MTSFCLFPILLVKGLPLPQIAPRVGPQQAVAAGTGTLGRLVYGVISIICLSGLAFALGTSCPASFTSRY